MGNDETLTPWPTIPSYWLFSSQIDPLELSRALMKIGSNDKSTFHFLGLSNCNASTRIYDSFGWLPKIKHLCVCLRMKDREYEPDKWNGSKSLFQTIIFRTGRTWTFGCVFLRWQNSAVPSPHFPSMSMDTQHNPNSLYYLYFNHNWFTLQKPINFGRYSNVVWTLSGVHHQPWNANIFNIESHFENKL